MNALAEYAYSFYKQKQLFHKNILSVDKKKENELEITYKDKKATILCTEQIPTPTHATIFCENTKENVTTLIKNWNDYVAIQDCIIFFIDTTSHKKWYIHPHMHAKICKPENTEKSILALYDFSLNE